MWLPSIIMCCWTATSWAHDSQILVTTQAGVVRGVSDLTAAGQPFFSFQGIPYARAAVGALRFTAPQRHLGWSGVRDASQPGSKCLQTNPLHDNALEGSEDCLFVNVYTPWLPGGGGAARPVMVWVHGGGFVFGNGGDETYGAHYLLDGGVLLVTFNYRLGVFGFFSMEDATAPGNYGLHDQVMLLHWVQDNIAAFGGDPQLVTVFGESAGGASVSLLVMSPLTEGLFHRAISQSGAANYNWAASEKKRVDIRQFVSKFNCSGQNSTATLGCMRLVNATALQIITQESADNSPFPVFPPRIDKEPTVSFLPDHPRILLENGKFKQIPWMIGITEEECTHLTWWLTSQPGVLKELADQNHTTLFELLHSSHGEAEKLFDCGVNSTAEVAKIMQFYWSQHGNVSEDNRLAVIRLLSDYFMVAPITEEASLASRYAPVYSYVLDHRGPGRLRISDVWPAWSIPQDYGVGHGDDIPYLFSSRAAPRPAPDSPAYAMIRFMVDVWTTFARTGRPSSTVFPMPEWSTFTETDQRYMRLNARPSLVERPFADSVRFWRSVPVNDAWKHAVQTNCGK